MIRRWGTAELAVGAKRFSSLADPMRPPASWPPESGR